MDSCCESRANWTLLSSRQKTNTSSSALRRPLMSDERILQLTCSLILELEVFLGQRSAASARIRVTDETAGRAD